VKYFDWDDAKNAKVRAGRGIGFEDVVFHIARGDLLDIPEHPNPDRYGGAAHIRRSPRGLRVPGAVPAFARQFATRLRRGLAEALRAEAEVEESTRCS
jgi:hypothetical protein